MFTHKVTNPQPTDRWGLRVSYIYPQDISNVLNAHQYRDVNRVLWSDSLKSYNPILTKKELIMGRSISAILITLFFCGEYEVNNLLMELDI